MSLGTLELIGDIGDEAHVELVDPFGAVTGVAPKALAHQAPGLLHRAVSVFLLDETGRLILQRRAADKYHSASMWSNTCCGHPMPGESPNAAASRRAASELGLSIDPDLLVPVGSILYEWTDPQSGMWEREFDHLFVGWAHGSLRPDPAEVSDVRLIDLADVDAAFLADRALTGWFPKLWPTVVPALSRLADT